MSTSVWTKLAALLVIAILVLTMTAHQVRFTETAVVTRFDRVVRVIPTGEAGLIFTAPWPIDRVRKFDARLRTYETEFTQLSTEDLKTITVTAFATWRIGDAETYLRAVGREEAAAEKIGDLVRNQVSNVLRRHPLSDLVNVDPQKLKFDDVERDILASVAPEAMKTYGVAVERIGIKRLGLPESNTREVFERMKADRMRQVNQLASEGDAKATQLRSNAKAMANKIVARAEAYAKKLRAEGDARAAQYYGEFAKAEELSSFLKQLDAAKQILQSGQTTIILDAERFVPFGVLQQTVAPRPTAERIGTQP